MLELRCSHRSLVFLLALMICLAPTVGFAGGDEVLFRYAVALQKSSNASEDERDECFNALARLRRPRETLRISELWPPEDDIDREWRLWECWENELYFTGLSLARRSKLSLSIKLTSLASHERPPPERVITELLNRESGTVTQADRDVVTLLRFAASFDEACRRTSSKKDFAELIPAAIAVAPRALRLLDTTYPPGHQYHLGATPVLSTVAECRLAILLIVPLEKRTDAVTKVIDSFGEDGGATTGCAARGWIPAVELGCDLNSDEQAVFDWQSALLEDLSVDLRSSDRPPAGDPKSHPRLHRWRSQTRGLMKALRSRSYKDDPEHFATFFREEEDSDIWRVHVRLSLKAARVRADNELLQMVIWELFSQSTRIHGGFANRGARDLTRLYQSAHSAAVRVGDETLQQESIKRIIAIYPDALREVLWEADLSDLDDEIPVWVRIACDSSRDSAVIRRFEDVILEQEKVGNGIPSGSTIQGVPGSRTEALRSLGAFWAITGAPQSKTDRIRGVCKGADDNEDVAFGVGIAVGCVGSTLIVSEAWKSLSDAKFGGTLKSLTAFCNGYAEGKEDRHAKWTARFIRELRRPAQAAK